ncbi:YafY family protein [Nostoc sp. JL23]|uniref:helix-turn-helix transcriptional regulator n=1 Tax=Nostoc sp. JL23 TaxID=2815394 RepID=UPI001D20058E|nr:WYL domain-containing protein [Nostoc sp. JL23]MBN3877043.1 WYL domain-containing protein [Nostoc sp. JL23]
MPKKLASQPYKEHLAFERLMLLIATLLKHPGIGSPDLMDSRNDLHHDALATVQKTLQELATELKIELPAGYPAVSTLRKDLETLRHYTILDQRMYRWGYYLGTAALSSAELKVAFNALASLAQYQGDAQVRRIYETLSKRLRGLDMELKGDFFYPTRQYLNRTIVYSDPEEMAEKGKHQDTLFHQLPLVEKAISQGQAIEISRGSDLYGNNRIGPLRIFPLQLIYQDIAWYLLYEYCETGHLAIGRLNRFRNYCVPLGIPTRGLELQRVSLTKAYRLIENGWGLNLGDIESQKLELEGNLDLIKVEVHFFPPMTGFILEGERRHPKQKIIPGIIDKTTGKPSYVIYTIDLPKRSIDEFSLWVYRHMDKAQMISPSALADKHHQAAIALAARYSETV